MPGSKKKYLLEGGIVFVTIVTYTCGVLWQCMNRQIAYFVVVGVLLVWMFVFIFLSREYWFVVRALSLAITIIVGVSLIDKYFFGGGQ